MENDLDGGSPSRKKVRAARNDSFYDSDEDEVLNELCSTGVSERDVSSNMSAIRTPLNSRVSQPASSNLRTPIAFTLTGKPLKQSTPLTSNKPNPGDELLMSSSRPFLRLVQEKSELEEANKTLQDRIASILEERDKLQEKVTFLEKSLESKENEIADLNRQKLDPA
ncbi:hypothetical protein DdX_09685 [Ditylenchus destructor]|uniref:Uncharacterized protein n=1 Tax=Ditylenchus destructor TaxID=166010 RepID=A0AAD4N0C1_9BILA|nr:hypothetical protein DdX_09685 [Ditylenchus destructor]